MKLTSKLITLSLSLLLTLSIGSCGKKKEADASSYEAESKKTALAEQAAKTHESVKAEFVTSLEEMRDSLASIKDLDTAKSALPKLTGIGFKMKRIKTDMEKLGKPSPELKAKLDKLYGSETKEIMMSIGMTMRKLKDSNPEAYTMLEKIMKTILQ